jgi:hypothetical protein
LHLPPQPLSAPHALPMHWGVQQPYWPSTFAHTWPVGQATQIEPQPLDSPHRLLVQSGRQQAP